MTRQFKTKIVQANPMVPFELEEGEIIVSAAFQGKQGYEYVWALLIETESPSHA